MTLREAIVNKYGSVSQAGKKTGLGSQRINSAILNHERGHKLTAPSIRMFCFLLEMNPDEFEELLAKKVKTHYKLINEEVE